MKHSAKATLLLGVAAILSGSGLAFAQMDGPPPPDGPMQGLMHREGGRLADRLSAEFDLNHDGKVTHTEYNTVIANRYGKAVHGAKGMNYAMFVALHMPEFQKHTSEMFKRIDWKGDGKITLDEYAAPQRAHFEMLDNEAGGFVSCAAKASSARANAGEPDDAASGSGKGRRGGGRGAGGFGLGHFCFVNDLNQDGKVTRAELDTAVTKHFAAATKNKGVMSAGEFYADQLADFQDMNSRMFKRLDRDRDGLLTLQEYASSEEKLFARLDKNGDGTLGQDEMGSRLAGRGGSGKSRRG